jgi:hypothetical protein
MLGEIREEESIVRRSSDGKRIISKNGVLKILSPSAKKRQKTGRIGRPTVLSIIGAFAFLPWSMATFVRIGCKDQGWPNTVIFPTCSFLP